MDEGVPSELRLHGARAFARRFRTWTITESRLPQPGQVLMSPVDLKVSPSITVVRVVPWRPRWSGYFAFARRINRRESTHRRALKLATETAPSPIGRKAHRERTAPPLWMPGRT